MKLWEIFLAGLFADELLEQKERHHNELMEKLDPRNDLDWEDDSEDWDYINGV